MYALFFKDRPTAIRQYAKNHQYRGATQDVNGVWDSSFFFVQVQMLFSNVEIVRNLKKLLDE